MGNNNQTVKNPYELNEPPKPEWLDEAIAKYESKLDFVVLGSKLEQKKPSMDLKFSSKTYNLDWALRKIMFSLDRKGVLSEFRAEYIAYGLELFRVWSRFRPQVWKWISDYKRELKIIAQKWKNRGLKVEVMRDIAILLNTNEIIEYL
jgi:predicted component of type VI protein secretion system